MYTIGIRIAHTCQNSRDSGPGKYRGVYMRLRKQEIGTKNIVGRRIEQARKNIGMKQKELLAQLQVNGVDMNASGLSKLEGQIRSVNDYELVAFSKILGVSMEWLLGMTDEP